MLIYIPKYTHSRATIPEPSGSEVELAIDKLKGHKSTGFVLITAEMIEAGGRTIC